MAVHGVARSTIDLDLLVTAAECLDPLMWAPLSGRGITVDVRPGGHDDPLAGVVRLSPSTPLPIDVVVGKWRWQADIIARARDAAVHGVTVPVATAADLVLLKLYAGGPQDLWDVEQLLAAHDQSALLIAAVDAVIAALPTDAGLLWTRVRERATPDPPGTR